MISFYSNRTFKLKSSYLMRIQFGTCVFVKEALEKKQKGILVEILN